MQSLATRTCLLMTLMVFIAFVFVQSPFSKFSHSSELQSIFGTLDGGQMFAFAFGVWVSAGVILLCRRHDLSVKWGAFAVPNST